MGSDARRSHALSCVKYLGSGFFSDSFLLSDGRVLRIGTDSRRSDAVDSFVETIIPSMPARIKRHFIEREPQRLVRTELSLVQTKECETHMNRSYDGPIYATTMQYGGTRANLFLMSKNDIKDMVCQLLVVIDYLIEHGYIHRDIHIGGNIL
jgi:hypothetical protein